MSGPIASTSRAVLSSNKYYDCWSIIQSTPLPFGAEVILKNDSDLMNLDLENADFVKQLKEDIHKHRLLLFKKQTSLTGSRQVDISRKLGEVHSTFHKHHKSPHPDIFRVSNVESEGCTNVGRSGWHLDGTFLPSPFKYQTMHFPSVIDGGDTWFAPLKELYESRDAATKEKWDHMWMDTGRYIHPLVTKHPTSKETTLCFHCGPPFVQGWLVDEGPGDDLRKTFSDRQYLREHIVQGEITKAIDDSNLVLKMKWEAGDFAINDNIALAHYAVPGTQQNPGKSGLRILHRTTVLDDDESNVLVKEDGRTSFTLSPSDRMR